MDINPQTALTIMLLIFGGVIYYKAKQLRNKIYCSFRRVDKTKLEKFVPRSAEAVIFDGGKYLIDTKRITLLWWNRGIHQFFPQWVQSLDFSWYSQHPHDPDDWTNTWDTPSARNLASSEEDWKGFNKAMKEQVGSKKTGFFEQYKTIIIIIAVVVVAYLFYQQGQASDARMTEIEAILGRL